MYYIPTAWRLNEASARSPGQSPTLADTAKVRQGQKLTMEGLGLDLADSSPYAE